MAGKFRLFCKKIFLKHGPLELIFKNKGVQTRLEDSCGIHDQPVGMGHIISNDQRLCKMGKGYTGRKGQYSPIHRVKEEEGEE